MNTLNIFLLVIVLLAVDNANCLDLTTFYRYLNRNISSSPECEVQKEIFLKGLEEKAEWAWRMLDAFGRIPAALSQGNRIDLGLYDQCVEINEVIENVDIKGRYCLAGFMLSLPETEMPAMLSVCLPNACYPTDFFGSSGSDDACLTKNQTKAFEAEDTVFTVILVFILLVIIASTAYDLYLQKRLQSRNHNILLAFSIYTNGSKIIKSSQKSSGQILFFNGMKVISMVWIIVGHCYAATKISYYINSNDVREWENNSWLSIFFTTYSLAVDTFFFISGALLAYSFLKSIRKPNTRFNILIYYARRYFRLTPALAMVFFFQVTLARRIVAGPFSVIDTLGDVCRENWWQFFLYIQNYMVSKNMCLSHTWYVDVDMQFILVSPLILIPLARYLKRMTYIGLPILIFFTTTYVIFILYFYDVTSPSFNYNGTYYTVAHTRFPPWFMGIMFGSYMLSYKDNPQYRLKNKIVNLAMWILTLAVMSFILLYQRDINNNPTLIKSSLFIALHRPIWGLCIAWISYSCFTGNAQLVDLFLSLPIFQILSKITYSTYLIHMSLIVLNMQTSRTLAYFTEYELIQLGIVITFISMVVGALWTLAFELPGINIGDWIFGPGSKIKRNDTNNDQLGIVDSRHNLNYPVS